jgi:hypothetical protein
MLVNGAVDAMSRLAIYFMNNAGEELTTEVLLDGLRTIRSRGLKVFVGTEEIEIYQGKWKNSVGLFPNLEDAVKDALSRERGQGS